MKTVIIPTEHYQSDDGTLHPTAAACELHDLEAIVVVLSADTMTDDWTARALQKNKAAILAAFVPSEAAPAKPFEFNINDIVEVKLTSYGIDVLRSKHDPRFGVFAPPATDADGWARYQLWELMAIFGSFLHMAGPLMFATTIRVPRLL